MKTHQTIVYPVDMGYKYWETILTHIKKSTSTTTNTNNTSIIIQIIYYSYIMYIYYESHHFIDKFSYKSKFGYIKENVLDNVFMNEQMKEEFLTLFAKIQRTYYGFSRLAYIYKLRKAKLVIDTDLYLNTIEHVQNNVITIYQNNSKYLFIISDLINIINNNLSHAPNFFVDPLIIKNPYNNIKFNRTILYNIYFFIKFKNGMVMPELLQRYFIANFNIKHFKTDNECLIREYAIKSFVFTSSTEILFPFVGDMLHKFKRVVKNISIHRDFPKDKLVDIMRPYLHLYYIHTYAIFGTMQRFDAYNILRKKLRLFARFNGKFGRKHIHFSHINSPNITEQLATLLSVPPYPNTKKYKYPHTISFNDTHINFYKEYNEYEFPDYFEEYELRLLNRHLNYRITDMFRGNDGDDSDNSDDSAE